MPGRPAPRPTPRPPPQPAAPAPEGVRVSKLKTERGLCSRREADEWIEAGWVRVNGAMAVLGQRVATDAVITIDPRASQEQLRRVTVLLRAVRPGLYGASRFRSRRQRFRAAR